MKDFYTPQGKISVLYKHMTKQTHVLIAGTTGSGKSVVTRGVLNSLLYRPFCDVPGSAEMILIDPKGTELVTFSKAPHCIRYATAAQSGDMIGALRLASALVDRRFSAMQNDLSLMDEKHYYKGSDIWVVIDELADLMLSADSAEVKRLIQHIGQIGRAARVHLLCCTQCPLVKVIPTEIKVNFDAILALRTRSAQDSRNIIGCKGAELFPKVGKGMYQNPDTTNIVTVDLLYVDDTETERLVNHWLKQIPSAFCEKHDSLVRRENSQNAEISPSAISGNEEYTTIKIRPVSWFKFATIGLLLVDVIARVF